MAGFKSRRKISDIMTMIFLICLSLLMISPLLLMITTSLKTMAEIQGLSFNILPEKIMFSNYLDVISDGKIFHYMRNSLVITIITVAGSLLFNSLAGYGFARLRFPGRNILFFIMLIGIMVPPQVIMLPTFILMKNFPLIGGNDILGNGGVGFINTYAGLIIPFLAGSFGVFMCRQFYMSFPKSLDEAAKLDGAGRIKTFFYIYLPLSKSILATLAIFKTNAVWNDYTWPLIMTNTEKMRTIQLGLTVYRGEAGTQWQYLMAATTISLIPIIVLFLFLQKYFVQGVATSGLKG